MDTINISALPRELTEDDSVGLVYRDDLDWIEDKLRQGLSVLVECDKQLTLYLYKAIRKRLKRRGATRMTCRLISGHVVADPDAPIVATQNLMQRILSQLQEAVFSGEPDQVVVLSHLDILTTTTRSGLNADARETAALLYENPALVLLAFQDPSFEIPEVIRSVFPARREIIGIPRERLGSIILQREARKLALTEFNPYTLYRYLSGINAVRARQILSHFSDRADFDPSNPQTADKILAEIRQMTISADTELPRVDLKTDIGGYEAVKQRIQTEILDLLTMRRTADAETGRTIDEIVPKGIIFHGPPGTGKTFFAKAIATALDATITIVSGPELKSRWVGESEANLRRIFATARRSAPSIIVFDELDSFASARGTYTGSGVEHSMVNQLLTEMDGFRKEELVFVVGTTNFMASLDPALLRPGRFELGIEIPYPDEDARRAILDIYRRKFHLNFPDSVLDHAVRLTGGFVDVERGIRFSGDHLYAAARALKREVLRRGAPDDALTEADVDKVLNLRSSAPVRLTDEEERCVAIHEAGHAVCAYLLPHCPTIERISIATGQEQTLGYVMQAVKERRYITTKAELLDDISVLLAGQGAEEMVLGDVSVGAWSDLQRATEIARMMVEELGMSALGPRNFHHNGERAALSDPAAARIDAEIDNILHTARDRTAALLADNREDLERLAALLVKNKEANLKDMKAIFGDTGT
ncbi:MAG: cell division protease FtsH [Myxococcota bacterium]|jgi:cell division protease FtsH